LSFIGNLVGDVLGGVTGAKQGAKAAGQAAQTQAAAADRAIAEARAARTDAAALQEPFVQAGRSALAQQMALIGLNGTTAQQDAIGALTTSPEYTGAVQQGEEAILANASATGGLRGGNTNNSLARVRGDLLQQLIAQKYNQFGGLVSLGQNAAAGVGNNGLVTAQNIGRQLTEQGEAIAGGQIARGNVTANAINTAVRIAGTVAGF